MMGKDAEGEPSQFSQIIEASYLGYEGAMLYLDAMVDNIMDNRFNREPGYIGNCRDEAAEALLDGGVVTTMDDGRWMVDIACQDRIRQIRRNRHGEA